MFDKLTHVKVEILFGAGFQKDGVRVLMRDHDKALRKIKKAASAAWFGWTMVETTGGWGEVVERGYSLYTLVPAADVAKLGTRELADVIKAELNQQAVFVVATPVNAVEY